MSYNLINPKSPLRIGIDVDGVLANFAKPYLDALNHISGQAVSLNWQLEPDRWKWEQSKGFSYDDVEKFWKITASKPAWWRQIPLLSDFNEVNLITNLIQQEDVYFITSRPAEMKKATEDWLALYFTTGVIDRQPTVIISNNKGPIARGLDLHCIFDDKPSNLESVLLNCGNRTLPFLIDRPYNRVHNSDMIIRVNDIHQGLAILRKEVYNEGV